MMGVGEYRGWMWVLGTALLGLGGKPPGSMDPRICIYITISKDLVPAWHPANDE